jgi:hypothetical protein
MDIKPTSAAWPTPPVRAWSVPCWSGPRPRARWPGRWRCRPSPCITWKGTCWRRCWSRTRRSRRSWRCWSPAGTHVDRCRSHRRYRLLGDTLDDAAGEAFDKTAKLMGLPYPGGPALARLAETATPGSSVSPPMTDRPGLDFSFSGLKTQVLLAWQDSDQRCHARVHRAWISRKPSWRPWPSSAERAMLETGRRTLVVAGGVGANRRLRSAAGRWPAPQGWFRRSLSAPGVLHRQRRDDRVRRRACACMPASNDPQIRVFPRWDLQSAAGAGVIPSIERDHGHRFHRRPAHRDRDRHLRLGARIRQTVALDIEMAFRQYACRRQRSHRRHARLQGRVQAPDRLCRSVANSSWWKPWPNVARPSSLTSSA